MFGVSIAGVADDRTMGYPRLARITATSRAWYWTPSSCLKLGSCASSTTISPARVGQEERGAGANRHLRLAAGNRRRRGGVRCAVAVPGDRRTAEAGLEALQEGFCQRDLGQQDQCLTAGSEAFGDRLEIDFGLARSGDSVEQDRVESLADRARQAVRCRRLVRRKLGRREIGVRSCQRLVSLDRDRSSPPAWTSPRKTASLTSQWRQFADRTLLACQRREAFAFVDVIRSGTWPSGGTRSIAASLPAPTRRQHHPQHGASGDI